MKGMKEAVARIRQAALAKEKVLIHGDYDVDGVTASAIIAKTLDILGIAYQIFLPERFRDGYGVSEKAIREAAEQGAKILITADCGITAHQEIEAAVRLGMEVIVIDHHRIPPQGVPAACIILNPQQTDCAYPSADLTAGGLAFKLSQALVGEEAYKFLELAALSTVCDVAPLKGENRIIVKYGLKALSKHPSVGLKALAAVAGVKSEEMNTGHLGFIFGPRINAAGRMSSPEMAFRLLMTTNRKEAESLAVALNEENKLRQKEERQVVKEAIQEVDRTVNFNKERVIVIGREGWHQGVVGIVAARLVERYYRPSVVIAFEKENGKGSGRSIRGFNLFQALQACSETMEEFGGHEQAVGLSLRKEKLPQFRKKINQYASETLPAELFVKKVSWDLEIALSEITSIFVQEIKCMEPFGTGNPRPAFLARQLTVKTQPVYSFTNTVEFHVTDGQMIGQAVWSPKKDESVFFGKNDTVDLYFTLRTKQWNGVECLSLEVKDIQKSR